MSADIHRQEGPRKCLFLANRVVLCDAILAKSDKKGLGFLDYRLLTLDEVRLAPRLVDCLESLHKLCGRSPFDLVVVDEFESVLAQLASSTLEGHERETIAVVKFLLESADKVIVIDGAFFP